jgi:hypothetical protein
MLRFIKKSNYVTKQENYVKKNFKLCTSWDKNLMDMMYVQVLMKYYIIFRFKKTE